MQRRGIARILIIGVVVLILWMGHVVVFAQGPDSPPRPTPTVDPDAPVRSAGASEELPDLIVEEISISPSDPVVGRDFTIEVIVKNQGAGDVPEGNNFFVDLYIDPPSPPEPGVIITPPDYTWGAQYWWVPAGGEYSLKVTTNFTNTGGHQIYAVVDSGGCDGTGCVRETNEENNVAGPVVFTVQTTRLFRQSSHEDFQKGFSNLDLSHPRGLIQIGRYKKFTDGIFAATQQFEEPEFDPDIYFPDSRVNPASYDDPADPGNAVDDTSLQIKPFVAKGPGDEAGVVWEDWRRGDSDSDVYFSLSTDNGRTWNDPVRISNDDPANGASQLSPVIVYNKQCSRYHAFWADDRLGSFDIFHAYSSNGVDWTEPAVGPKVNPINTFDDDPLASQTHPTVALDENGTLYVAWQDRRKGNDDIFFAYSTDCGATWSTNVFVTDEPNITTQNQRAPAVAIVSGDTFTDTRVLIAWQDQRTDAGDIFVTLGGAAQDPPHDFSFDIDFKLNNDEGDALQRDPALGAIETTVVTKYEVVEERGGGTELVTLCDAQWRTVLVHVAWQDYRNGNADVFYGWFFADVIFDKYLRGTSDPCDELRDQNRPDSAVQGNFNVGTSEPLPIDIGPQGDPDQSACWGPNSDSTFSVEDAWQGEPAVAVFNELRAYVAWSDGRSDDERNFDVHLMRFERNDVESQNFLDFTSISMVNDNVKRLDILTNEDSTAYDELYQEFAPAGASQRRPVIFLERPDDTGDPAAPLETFLVVWDDDRNTDPDAGGITNRDIFFTRVVDEPRGTYISPVIDAGAEATWYDIQWWAATQEQSELFFQVRLGNTPTPPLADETANGWTRWSGPGGVGGKYDAPGQNIRDADGSMFPKYRYAQYRLMINQDRTISSGDEDYYNGVCISEVTVNYQPKLTNVYLPVIFQQSGDSGNTSAVPDDEYYQDLQWNMDLIDAEAGWAKAKGDGVTIAVLDTGVDVDHPDLQSKLLSGFDFINDDSDPDDDDNDYGESSTFWGHGTHVAGIAAAVTDNNNGVAGVGWNAQILPIKVLDEKGTGTTSELVEGIKYAADQGADVINMSLGGTGQSTAVADAVGYARDRGALLVAAAGNERQSGSPTFYPAAYEGVVAVSAVTSDRTVAPYSNQGDYVDVAAPGGEGEQLAVEQYVWSTYPTDKGSGSPRVGYAGLVGTSMATPHVSGLAALIWSKNSGLNADAVADLIVSTAMDLGPAGRDDDFGYGLIDAGAAVALGGRASTLSLAAASAQPPVRVSSEPLPFNTIAAFKPGELLIGVEPTYGVQALEAGLAAYGVTRIESLLDAVWIAGVPAGQEIATIAALAGQAGIRYVEPNYYYYAQ